MARFEFLLRNGKTKVFDKWEDIPENFTFRNVIQFMPDTPPEPHTDEVHEEMAQWNTKLQNLLEKERASSN